MQRSIHIEGAKQHNLKNITVDIPHNALVVVCGPSGSGKSTLAFDIVYAEGQRRYVESLSAYARQFLDRLEKPLVDKIEGLSPAISLEQQGILKNPRSTVATTTEVYDFLRVLWARLGKPHCVRCGNAVEPLSVDEIVAAIMQYPEATKMMLLAPVVEYQKGTHSEILKSIKARGFVRVRIDGIVYTLEEVPELDKNKKHTIEVVVDRLVMNSDIRIRLAQSIETALQVGNGRIIVYDVTTEEEQSFSVNSMCPSCMVHIPQCTPQLFSFNSPQGACPHCFGIGTVETFAESLLIPDRSRSLERGGVVPLRMLKPTAEQRTAMEVLLEKYSVTTHMPLEQWPHEALQKLLYGERGKFCGVVRLLEQYENQHSAFDILSSFKMTCPCPRCKGKRLREEALAVTIEDCSIADFVALSVMRAQEWLDALVFTGKDAMVAEPLLREIKQRLAFMADVGLEYVTLERTMMTLSGGEAQRIRLASQLGSGLVGVTYVLDEPSIGLHPRDNDRLIRTLRSLQKKGNTVLVVEHDESTIRESDYVIEMGEGSGLQGGDVMFAGETQKLLESAQTITAKYLRGEVRNAIPSERRKTQHWLTFKGIHTHNICGMECSIPLGTLTCVTGVSGSGKSSLVVDTIYANVAKSLGLKTEYAGDVDAILGLEHIEKVLLIDQSPIGRTPRSNPATYTKLFDEIRTIFSMTPESRAFGYTAGRFSFNMKDGRCGACKGEGEICIEMHFLPDIYVPCEVCGGKRYNKATLDVLYKGKNIADVLAMSVSEARSFFANHPAIERKLAILEEVGLGYIQLGQPSTTISGGEAQRIKIAKELGKRLLPNMLYVLDEPTTGLHMHEVGKLITVLHTLVQQGATVLVIEHNTDVILAADYVIDLGPGGGEYGGKIVAEGTPEEIMHNAASETGKYILKEYKERGL